MHAAALASHIVHIDHHGRHLGEQVLARVGRGLGGLGVLRASAPVSQQQQQQDLLGHDVEVRPRLGQRMHHLCGAEG